MQDTIYINKAIKMASFSHYLVKNEHQIPELLANVSGEPTGTFLEQLNKNLKVEITNLTENEIEFDLVGVDASIANALRRILLAEVYILDCAQCLN